MTLAMRREFQFPADKRFHVKLTPMSIAHTCQLKLKPFSNLVSSLRLEMQLKSGSAASLEAETQRRAFPVEGWERGNVKASSTLAFTLS
ncbi:MAG: hypothetical protein V7L31_19700 [Nostoc sp.]|uniref:hypothetical protein n=1 Tax=Nostoc sp. TaxID=1180 RepID=UPI002FEFD6AA